MENRPTFKLHEDFKFDTKKIGKISREEFNEHDDFIFENKKVGEVTREEFVKYVRTTHDHMRELSQDIQEYDQTIDDYLKELDGTIDLFELNESVRVSNEEERISKDSERDSKINSKANKSMLLSPKYDLVYDSCVRNVNTPLNAYSVSMESGHYFVNVDERETDTTLTYEPDGVLVASPVSNNIFSPVLIEDFDVIYTYINVRFNNANGPNFNRSFYIKYLNKQNWIRVDVGTNTTIITSCIDGVETEIGRQINPLNNDFGERYGLVQDIHIDYRRVHNNTSPSSRAVVVRQDDRESFAAGVPIEVANLFNNQGKVGFDVQRRTEILNFKAGSVS